MDAKAAASAIVRKLVNAGYTAYFAGGWVRDYIMGHPSEDIDIATNAPPEKIMDLFPRTILVGLAFGVVIVIIEGHQFEIATFRRDVLYVDGRRPEQIELSTPQEDAKRRDFTINGMFYDPIEDVIHDFVHGYHDVKMGVIRTIGDPNLRFSEDRLRMIRAIRFAARFNFNIDISTQQAIIENAETLLPAVAMERIWQEFNKMNAYPRLDWAIAEMHQLGLLQTIFPELKTMHLKEVRSIVSAYAFFPQGTPVILNLMALFPNQTLHEKIEICRRLKASRNDMDLIEFYDQFTNRIKEGKIQDDTDYAHLYAHPHAKLAIYVQAAEYPEKERESFIKEHESRIQRLQTHIDRIRLKTPLVHSTCLIENGIAPGKQMGALLKEAERIAINTDCSKAEIVLKQLKHSHLWPAKTSND